MDYGILEEGDIETFESIATEIDLDYIDRLINACIKWTMQGTEIGQKRLRRDEIKTLGRVAYRVKKHGKN